MSSIEKFGTSTSREKQSCQLQDEVNILRERQTTNLTLEKASAKSLVDRAGTFTESCIKAIPSGFENSLFGIAHIQVPYSKVGGKALSIPVPIILENAALGATVGYVATKLLPQAGVQGKICATAFGVVMAAPLLNSGIQIYEKAKTANNMRELQLAGHELGWGLGSLAGGLSIGSLTYSTAAKLGMKPIASECTTRSCTIVTEPISTSFENTPQNNIQPGTSSFSTENAVANSSTSKFTSLSPRAMKIISQNSYTPESNSPILNNPIANESAKTAASLLRMDLERSYMMDLFHH